MNTQRPPVEQTNPFPNWSQRLSPGVFLSLLGGLILKRLAALQTPFTLLLVWSRTGQPIPSGCSAYLASEWMKLAASLVL